MSSSVSDLHDVLECSICLDTLNEPKILPCTHRFCRECIHKEIERFDTSTPHACFPCPQCRGLVPLKKLDENEKYVDQLQTDRLLRKIIESLEDDPDLCTSHQMKREIVCYSCHETGCLRCAWSRHRTCSKTGDYQQEVVRIENLLSENLIRIRKCLKSIDDYVKAWTRALRSYKNQLTFSGSFFKNCLDSKRDAFLSSVQCIRTLWDSFSKSNLNDSPKITTLLNERMKESFDKLNIDRKYELAELRFDEISKTLVEQELEAATRLRHAPERKPLENMANEISNVLKVDKSAMVVRGEKLLLENKNILSKSMLRQLQKDTSKLPSSYILAGLITQEQQIDFELKDEEELVEKLLPVLEATDDQKGLLDKLNELTGYSCPSDGTSASKNYFRNVRSFVQVVYRKMYSVKDSQSGLFDKGSSDLLPVKSTQNIDPCSTNSPRCVIGALKLLPITIIGLVLLVAVSWIVSNMTLSEVCGVLSGLFGLFIWYLLLNQRYGGGVVGQMNMGMIVPHRKRRRRRNTAIDFIATTDTHFQVPRHVLIEKRLRLR